MSTPTNQVARPIKGIPLDASSSRLLSMLLSDADWSDPTAAEKREADALCSGVVSNKEVSKEAVFKAELLRSVRSFAEDHGLEPDAEAIDRFVIGMKRLLDDGRLERAHVQHEIGQAAGPSALIPSDWNRMGQLVMTRSQADTLRTSLLEILLDACLSYRGDGNQSDASTLASEGEAPVGFRMLRDRRSRLETFECNCQGDCHHMNKTRNALTGAPTTTDATDEYQGERARGRLGAIMRTVTNFVMSILRKILGLRSGRYQQDVERNTAHMRAGSVARL